MAGSFFRSLFAALGLVSAQPVVAAAPDPDPAAGRGYELYLDLLTDLAAAHGDTSVVPDFVRQMESPEEADIVQEQIDFGGQPSHDEMAFLIARELAVDNALLLVVDWAEGHDEIFGRFSAQMDISDEERQAMIAYVESQSNLKRGDVMGWLYGPLAALAESKGKRIIDLNTNSDAYHFSVVPKAVYDKWVGVKFSRDVRVDDPSWQFEEMLKGSPYARFILAR